MEIVRRLYAAMDALDVEAIARLAHPDVEWVPDRRVGSGPVRGRENVIRFFADRAEMFAAMRTEIEQLWDAGDRVLAFLRVTGEGGASGVPFEIRIGHLWTIREGLVVRGEGYGDRDEALRAAGVSE